MGHTNYSKGEVKCAAHLWLGGFLFGYFYRPSVIEFTMATERRQINEIEYPSHSLFLL